jgi:photoactive yellow protein
MEHARLVHLAKMTDAEIEPAPFGGIVVDVTGTIELNNAYESTLAKLAAGRVLGKNFFHDVAPCTSVAAFEGRFLEFVASEEPASDSFAYFFPFTHGDANVLVAFVKRDAPLEDFYSPIVPRSIG